MTREQWAKLTDVEKRIKVAGLCGYRVHNPYMHVRYEHPLRGYKKDTDALVPDYLNDLNVMHEVEETLKPTWGAGWYMYASNLHCVAYRGWNATAAQRAEAFVLTMEPK